MRETSTIKGAAPVWARNLVKDSISGQQDISCFKGASQPTLKGFTVKKYNIRITSQLLKRCFVERMRNLKRALAVFKKSTTLSGIGLFCSLNGSSKDRRRGGVVKHTGLIIRHSRDGLSRVRIPPPPPPVMGLI